MVAEEGGRGRTREEERHTERQRRESGGEAEDKENWFLVSASNL